MKVFIFFILQLCCLNVFAQFPFELKFDVSEPLVGKTIFIKIWDNYSENKFTFVDSFMLKTGTMHYAGVISKPSEQAEFFIKDKNRYSSSFYIDSGVNKFDLVEPDKRLYKRLRLKFRYSPSNILNDTLNEVFIEKHFATEKLKGSKRDSVAGVFNHRRLDILKRNPDNFASLIELYILSYNPIAFKPADLFSVFHSFSTSIKSSSLGIELEERLKRAVSTGVGISIRQFTSVTDAGNTFSSQSLSGSVHLIVFGAPWCLPCKENLPVLKEIYRKVNNKGFKIVMINLDDNKENWEKEIEEIDQDWIFLNDNKKFDESDLAKEFAISVIPQYLIVDKQGVIRYNFLNSGGTLNEKGLQGFITRLLVEE